MPLGPFGEVVGTTGTLEALGPDASNYRSKVIAPRNPKLLKDHEEGHKVWQFNFCIFYLAFDIHGLFQTLKFMFKDNSQTLYVYTWSFLYISLLTFLKLEKILCYFQMTPSKFLFDMQMNTEQKLANTHIMRIPKKIELLDMADTSLQKVCQYNHI